MLTPPHLPLAHTIGGKSLPAHTHRMTGRTLQCSHHGPLPTNKQRAYLQNRHYSKPKQRHNTMGNNNLRKPHSRRTPRRRPRRILALRVVQQQATHQCKPRGTRHSKHLQRQRRRHPLTPHQMTQQHLPVTLPHSRPPLSSGDETTEAETSPRGQRPRDAQKQVRGIRVKNKAGKYIYKQHNKRGNYQRRPPPQQQGGPGWGLLYRPQHTSSRNPISPGGSNPLAQPGSKAATAAREDWSKLLNKHLEPRSTATEQASSSSTPPQGPSTPADQTPSGNHKQSDSNRAVGTPAKQTRATEPEEPAQQNSAPSSLEATDTKQATVAQAQYKQRSRESPYERWQREAKEAAAASQSRAAAKEREAQAEWAASQAGTYQGDLPPDIHLPTIGGQVTFTQLTQGCWEIQIEGQRHRRPTTGLPPLKTVKLGQFGPLERAPPFTTGMIGRLAPMAEPNTWLLTVVNLPDLDDFEPNTMLLVEGDQFMCELTPRGWGLRVHRLAPSAARDSRQPAETAKPEPSAEPSADPSEEAAPTIPEQETTAAATPERGTDTQAEAEEDPEEDQEDDQEGDHRPPHVPLSPYAEAEVTPLGEGRWQISVRSDGERKPREPGSLPTTVIEGDGGPVADAPAISIGTEGVLEFLTADLWTLDIETTPTTIAYEGDTMLLTPGDRLLFERQADGWHVRVELLSPDAPVPISKLRQRRRNMIAANRRASKQQTSKPRGDIPPTIPEHSSEQDSEAPIPTQTEPAQNNPQQATGSGASASSSSSHESPQKSYYPNTLGKPSGQRQQTSQPTQTPQSQQRERYNILSDGRDLRRSQRERQAAAQAASSAQTTNSAATTASATTTNTTAHPAGTLHDGRQLRQPRHPPRDDGTGTTTTTTTATTTTTTPHGENHTTTTTTNNTVPADTESAFFMQTSWQQIYGGATRTQVDTAVTETQQLSPITPDTDPAAERVGMSAQDSRKREPAAAAQSSSRPSSRSWERVEQGLVAIRSIAQTWDDSQGRAIVAAAETALIDLLVDTNRCTA